MKTKLFTQALAITLLLFVNFLQGQTSFSGVVSDSETNEVIPGVNVVIQGTSEGTVSDFDGNFELKTSMQTPFTIEISSIGFETKSVEVTENDQQITVLLDAGQNLDEIVVTASRKPQKVQDAPSSVSLISAKDIENSAVAVDPVRHLQYIPGVQIQQQSANSINIEMRAGSGVFGTSTLPMLDYRFLATPAAGTFFTQQSGLSNIDIERIEVVRGAASALYGPGVASGVVHWISKSAIDHPGTTIELLSGTLNTRGAALRHAFASENKKIGFKVNAKWSAGNDFEMDPIKSASIISGFANDIAQPVVKNKMVDPTQRGDVLLSFQDLDDNNDGNPLATKYENFAVNAHLELRPNDKTIAFVSGGM
jgi:iron complex outermembrane receptor protein